MNPDFFHIGYQRTGTTFLQDSIFKQCEDELFFGKSKSYLFYKWKPELKCKIYKDVTIEKLKGRIFLDTGEAFSGDMFKDNYNFPKYIYEINKNAKIILTVRSQFSIIPSIYSLYIKKGGQLSFDEYLKLIVKNQKFNFFRLYNEYLKFFKKKQILVLFFEELIENPKIYTRKLLNFMKIKNHKINTDIKSQFKNASPGFGYIYCTYLLNKILNLEITEKYMSLDKREYADKNIEKRRVFLHPIFFLLNRFKNFFGKNKLKLNLDQTNFVKKKYTKDNVRFFKKLRNISFKKYYP